MELPGVTDRNLAIDLIKQTGQLEFVDGGVQSAAGWLDHLDHVCDLRHIAVPADQPEFQTDHSD